MAYLRISGTITTAKLVSNWYAIWATGKSRDPRDAQILRVKHNTVARDKDFTYGDLFNDDQRDRATVAARIAAEFPAVAAAEIDDLITYAVVPFLDDVGDLLGETDARAAIPRRSVR